MSQRIVQLGSERQVAVSRQSIDVVSFNVAESKYVVQDWDAIVQSALESQNT